MIEYLPSQYNKPALGSVSARAAYIVTVLGSKQRPFIWEHFRPGTIPIPRGEEAYYDEVISRLSHVLDTQPITFQKCHGPFQSIPILHAFSIYFTAYGIQMHPSFKDAEHLIGALTLAAAAVIQSIVFITSAHFPQVECRYYLHHTGDYMSCSNEFSATNWVKMTNMYINKINNDLTDDNWKAIFNALDRLQETCAHEARVKAGVVLEEREPLLPADPPTPPPI